MDRTSTKASELKLGYKFKPQSPLFVGRCPRCKTKQWVDAELGTWHCEGLDNHCAGRGSFKCKFRGKIQTYRRCGQGRCLA